MVCLGKIILMIVIIIILIVVSVQYCIFVKMCTDIYINDNKKDSSQILISAKNVDDISFPPIVTQTIVPPLSTLPPIMDPIREYDYQKLMDPLEEPTKRVDRHLLGPIEYRRMFNYPVRGYPDNPRWLGLLICEEEDHTNKILKLFGRQKYPGSSHYEYYTMINMGFDQIKVHIKRRQELYDDDVVNIPELNKMYKVKLNKDDDNSYNPYF